MLKRDEAETDHTLQYWPELNDFTFKKDFFSPEGMMLQQGVLQEDEIKNLLTTKNNLDFVSIGTALVFLLPAIYMHRIRFISDRINRRWLRGFTRVMMFMVPTSALATVFQKIGDDALVRVMGKYQMPYVDWKQNGDLRVFGSHVKVTNDYSL